MATKKISGYTEVTTYDDTSFYLLENSSGNYRKQSSSRLTRVITSSVTYTIGTGGNYANFVLAMDFLKNKWMPSNVIVTLRLCSDLHLTTRASYNFYNEAYAILYMKHPCSNQIVIDLNGYNIDVGDGTDTCHGFLAKTGCVLYLTNGSATTSVISSNKNGYGYGLYTYQLAFINVSNSTGHRIQFGASGVGFYNCIHSAGGCLIAGYSNLYYAGSNGAIAVSNGIIYAHYVDIANNASGFYSLYGSYIYRNGATGAQATNASPAVGVESSDGSWVM